MSSPYESSVSAFRSFHFSSPTLNVSKKKNNNVSYGIRRINMIGMDENEKRLGNEPPH